MENKIKILFSDLDGTLLDDNKSISKENMNAIQKMLELGHHFVVTTGRPLSSAIKKVEDLGLMKKGSYIINFQGGSIYDCGSKEEIYKKTLDLDKVEYIFEEAKKWGIHVQTYREDTVLSLEETKELQFYSKFVSMPYEVVDISMWKSVGTSVCMKNGQEEIKKFASFITENDNNHHGIREVIEKFVLN